MSKMQKLKNVFRPSVDKDDEAADDTSKGQDVSNPIPTTATASNPTFHTPATTANPATTTANPSTTASTTTTTNPTVSTQHEYLPPLPTSSGRLFDSSSPTDPVASAVKGTQDAQINRLHDDSSDLSLKSGKEGPFAPGADARAPDAEASKPDYEGITPGQTLSDRVAESDRLAAESESRENRSSTHPTSIPTSSNAGNESNFERSATTGGIIAVDTGDDDTRDPEVENATYTERKFTVGGGSSSTADPTTSSSLLSRPPLNAAPSMPHVPGEFPVETGEDAHEVSDPALSRSTGLGGQDGASAAAVAATGLHPGGAGFPVTSTGSAAATPQDTTSETHYGRDAAAGVGGGAAAAAAYAAYEHTKQPQTTASLATPATTTSQAAPISQAPRNNVTPTTAATTTGFTTSDSKVGEPQPTQEHHYGRDAAIVGGAGAAGAAGYGAYELGKDGRPQPQTQAPVQPAPAPAPAQPAPAPVQTQTRAPAQATPARDSKPAQTAIPTKSAPAETAATAPPTEPKQETHYGRDAAIVGGAGAAGAGGYALYEADKDQAPTEQSWLAQSSTEPLANRQAVTQQQEPVATSATTKADTARAPEAPPTQVQRTEEHHYGRDAAVVGGAGAAGAGVYEATKEPATDPAPTGDQGPITSQAAHTSQPVSVPEADTATPDNATSDNAAKPDHHYGRDAAVVGGAGAAGAGAYGLYEATKEPATKEPATDPAPTGDQGPIPSQAAHTSQPVSAPEADDAAAPEHHYGRDAAIAGGAAGAAGLGAAGVYEATRDPAKEATTAQQLQQQQQQQAPPSQPQEAPPQRTPSKLKKTPSQQKAQEQTPPQQKYQEQAPPPTQQYQKPEEETPYTRDPAAAAATEPDSTAPGAHESSSPGDLETTHHNKVITDSKGHSKLHKKRIEIPTTEGEGEGRSSGVGGGADYDEIWDEEYNERLHEAREKESERSGTASSGGEKKHGLLSKILHPNRTKREKEEAEEAARGSMDSAGAGRGSVEQ